MWTRAELKSNAKLALKANYWYAVLVCFIIGLLAGGSGGGGGSASSNSDITDSVDSIRNSSSGIDKEIVPIILGIVLVVFSIMAIAIVISTLFTVFVTNPVMVGAQRFFVKCGFVNKKPDIKDLGYAFGKNKYKTIVLGMFLKGLFQSLWGLLFIIPGIIKGYEYRMIPYLLAENPEMSYKEAFEASKIMMDGEKWNAFVLDLSFIGWGILSFFTCFLLSIFYVSPYQYLTNAQLYIVLRKKLEANGGTARYGLVEYSEEPAPETYNYDHNF
ncbi:MAG: DUF975 family protein [Clostridia bacterium]|nr:DUF975 family protein [Clostridia bacterium]